MENPLKKLAVQYHYLCEVYDRIVCTGLSDRTGDAIPANDTERRKVSLHALQRLREIYEKAERQGFTKEQLRQAIIQYANMSVEEMEVYLHGKKRSGQ